MKKKKNQVETFTCLFKSFINTSIILEVQLYFIHILFRKQKSIFLVPQNMKQKPCWNLYTLIPTQGFLLPLISCSRGWKGNISWTKSRSNLQLLQFLCWANKKVVILYRLRSDHVWDRRCRTCTLMNHVTNFTQDSCLWDATKTGVWVSFICKYPLSYSAHLVTFELQRLNKSSARSLIATFIRFMTYISVVIASCKGNRSQSF